MPEIEGPHPGRSGCVRGPGTGRRRRGRENRFKGRRAGLISTLDPCRAGGFFRPLLLPGGVMVAQATLTRLAMVRIHAGQPFDAALAVLGPCSWQAHSVARAASNALSLSKGFRACRLVANALVVRIGPKLTYARFIPRHTQFCARAWACLGLYPSIGRRFVVYRPDVQPPGTPPQASPWPGQQAHA